MASGKKPYARRSDEYYDAYTVAQAEPSIDELVAELRSLPQIGRVSTVAENEGYLATTIFVTFAERHGEAVEAVRRILEAAGFKFVDASFIARRLAFEKADEAPEPDAHTS